MMMLTLLMLAQAALALREVRVHAASIERGRYSERTDKILSMIFCVCVCVCVCTTIGYCRSVGSSTRYARFDQSISDRRYLSTRYSNSHEKAPMIERVGTTSIRMVWHSPSPGEEGDDDDGDDGSGLRVVVSGRGTADE